LALFARQPPMSFVSPNAVTYFGFPSTIARPFKWQRSDGSNSVTNGGRQRGVKLASASSVARQEKRVLANQSSGVREQESGVRKELPGARRGSPDPAAC
jgi:hypothetical protein